MKHRQSFRKSRLAEWGFRLSIIAAHLVVFTVLLHRFAGQSTAVSLNLLQIGFVAGFTSLILSLIATVQIWNQLLSGFGKAVTGVVISALVLAWPLIHLPLYLISEHHFDISTDVKRAPAFQELVKKRSFGANPVTFTKHGSFDQDITPLRINKPGQDSFDLARQLVLKRGWEVVSIKPPATNRGVGLIEAIDYSPIIAAADDIVIRVEQQGGQSVLDMRSASRYGSFDLGRNEDRILAFLNDITTQNAGIERIKPGEPRFRFRTKVERARPETEPELEDDPAVVEKPQ